MQKILWENRYFHISWSYYDTFIIEFHPNFLMLEERWIDMLLETELDENDGDETCCLQ